MYVELNEIRAGLADRPETSHYTSAAARIRGHKSRQRGSGRASLHDGWLSPIPFAEDEPPDCPVASSAGTMRASDLGVLDMSLGEYLKILDFSGCIYVRGKRDEFSRDELHCGRVHRRNITLPQAGGSDAVAAGEGVLADIL